MSAESIRADELPQTTEMESALNITFPTSETI